MTLKKLSSLLNNDHAPIKYYKIADSMNQNELLYFLSVSDDKRKDYEGLTKEGREEYISDSAQIYTPLIYVDELYERYNNGFAVSYDYSGTMQRIKKIVEVTEENEKLLFASYLILHEFGHWHSFAEKGRKPFLYNGSCEDEYRAVYELKKKIIGMDKSKLSIYKEKKMLKDYFLRYHLISNEREADEYADMNLKRAYEIIKESLGGESV